MSLKTSSPFYLSIGRKTVHPINIVETKYNLCKSEKKEKTPLWYSFFSIDSHYSPLLIDVVSLHFPIVSQNLSAWDFQEHASDI